MKSLSLVVFFCAAGGFLVWATYTYFRSVFEWVLFVFKKQPPIVFEIEITDIGAGVSILLHKYLLKKFLFIKYYREVSDGKYFGYTSDLIQFLVNNSISSIGSLYTRHSLNCPDSCNKLYPTRCRVLAELGEQNITITNI